jgi:hypothetical protein
MTKPPGSFALAVVVALISGCSGDLVPDSVSTPSSPIQGGTNDTTHLFAVGILGQMGGGTTLCSGALLAPNLVATARHCVAAIPAGGVVACPTTQFGALMSASNMIVTTDPDIRTGMTQYKVSQIITPSAANQAAVCGNDIALLILSQNVSLPEYVTPVLTPPMTDHTVYSTTVTEIGYGVSSPTDMTGTTAGIRRIKQNIALACISNDKTFTDCLPSMAQEVTASEFVSGNGTCEGDSGSSAYEEKNFDAGKWVSFGVLSRGGTAGGTCVGGIYSRFDAWASLIIGAAGQAAAMGGYPVPPWAAADGGTVPPADAGGIDAGRDAGRDAGTAVDAGTPRDAGSDAVKDAGVSPGSDGGAAEKPSSNQPDAGSPKPDGGGVVPDAGSTSDAAGTPPAASGCSCDAVGTRSGRAGWPAVLVGGLGMAVVAMRRRRRRQLAPDRDR